MTAVLV